MDLLQLGAVPTTRVHIASDDFRRLRDSVWVRL